MRHVLTPGAALAVILTVALAGCAERDAGGPSSATEPAPSASSADGSPQQITPGGVAAIVSEHLGATGIEEFTVYEQEAGSISVMVRLRDAGRADNFVVSVFDPASGDDFSSSDRCDGQGRGGAEVKCQTLADGTEVITATTPEGFSDDNEKGMVVSATVVPPTGGAALAMYESYDDTPPVTAKELGELLADERLTWMTDAAVNDAGADIRIRNLEG